MNDKELEPILVMQESKVVPQKSNDTLKNFNSKDALNPKEKLNLPLCVYNEDFFFGSTGYDPVQFNAWSRKNGWYRPINILFPLMLSLYAIGAGVYFGVFIRFIEQPTIYSVSSIVVAVLFILQLTFTLYTVTVDTEDSVVTKSNVQRNVNYIKTTGVPVIDPDTKFCNICQVVVSPQTKHCKPCNKCVADYDHHCQFLSTCIGKANYKSFFMTILLATILSVYVGIFSIYIFVSFFVDLDYYNQSIFGKVAVQFSNSIWSLIGVFAFGAAVVGCACGMCWLTVFHSRLMYVGISTYGYYESRAARGPFLWQINTREYRQRMKEANRYKDFA